MTDDARIQRLTELARRVWPKDDPFVIAVPSGASVWLYDKELGDVRSIHIISHPRALDALEAALLVLAGDVTMHGLRGAVLVPMLPGEAPGDQPAWVEKFLRRKGDLRDAERAGALDAHAAEVRERAKDEP